MARSPHPAIRPYEAQTAARPAGAPFFRAVDVSGGENAIAQSLGRAGQAVDNLAQTMTAIEVEEHRRRQDDARAVVAMTMARARHEANDIRRQAEQEAPDGWQGLTDTVATRWRERAQSYLEDETLTPEAREYLGQSLNVFEYDVLDNAAETENNARRAWRTDTVNQATDQNSNVLAADPSQWEEIRNGHMALIEGMHDLTADQRRDLADRAEGEFAISAVSGYVERDPRGALAALRDPEAGGPYAHLTGTQRAAFENRAQAELNRRQSEARARQGQIVASLRDTLNAQNQLLQRGVMPTQPLDPQTVATLLGPDVAQNYIANLASAGFTQQMATMPSSQVAQVAAGAASPEQSDLQNLLTIEGRNAATQVLQQRSQDPGGYGLRNGLLRHGELLGAVMNASGPEAWEQVGVMLRERGADAIEMRHQGVVDRIAPLSQAEAESLGAWVRQLPAQARLAFFSQASHFMNHDAYRAMMRQMAPSSGTVVAYAGARFAENPTLARRLMRGAEILQGGPDDPDHPGQNRRPLIDMPSDADMREQWERTVGDAYRRIPDAGGRAYESYRAYYAAASEEAGDTAAGSSMDRARTSAAIGAATGGTIVWNGHHTLMPAGMRAAEFGEAVRRGMQQWSFLRDADPRDYTITAIGEGRYIVEGLRNPVSGRRVEIEVRRPARPAQ